MTRKTLREAWDEYARTGDWENLYALFAAMVSAESRIVQGRSESLEPVAQLEVKQVLKQLSGGDEATREGILQLDRSYRQRVCANLKCQFPSLSCDDLVSIWQWVLLTLVRQAKRGCLDEDSLSLAAVWSVAQRCAARMHRRRCGGRSTLDECLHGTGVGRLWRMLSDLQQEEVLSLIAEKVRYLPPMEKTLFERYSRIIIERPLRDLAELEASCSPGPGGAESADSIVEQLRAIREQISAYLESHGYGLSESETDPVADDRPVAGSGQPAYSSFPLDRLMAEIFPRMDVFDHEAAIDEARAAGELTERESGALDDAALELPSTILFQHRMLPRPETALSTRRHSMIETLTHSTKTMGERRQPSEEEWKAIEQYDQIVREKCLDWAPDYEFVALLGEGGQGAVYMLRCPGSDGYQNLLALKIFDPRNCAGFYFDVVRNMARMAQLISSIRQPNLLDVIDFREQQGVRMMLMEWINGYDLGRLMVPDMLVRIRNRVDQDKWRELTRVMVCEGRDQPILKPGVAVAILRHCLAALAEMHSRGIVHGDIKPSNIMLTTMGFAKLIDIGSAFPWEDAQVPTHWTPQYLAPEVIKGKPYTPRSDLASLGYVLIELLSGRSLFARLRGTKELLEAKESLPNRLTDRHDPLLPKGASEDDRLVQLCRHLVAPDPEKRFFSAREADLASDYSAFRFLDQLTTNKMAVAWEPEIRRWLEYLS